MRRSTQLSSWSRGVTMTTLLLACVWGGWGVGRYQQGVNDRRRQQIRVPRLARFKAAQPQIDALLGNGRRVEAAVARVSNLSHNMDRLYTLGHDIDELERRRYMAQRALDRLRLTSGEDALREQAGEIDGALDVMDDARRTLSRELQNETSKPADAEKPRPRR